MAEGEERIRLEGEPLVLLLAIAGQGIARAVRVPVRAVEGPRVLAAGVVRRVDLRALLDADEGVGVGVPAIARVLDMNGYRSIGVDDDRRLDPVDGRWLVGG